jgi:GT2 family glycosyltransferase
MKTLSIITPWWNHLDLLAEYKKVIEASCANEVIVIDNGSEPPFECESFNVIRNETNRGFSRACNQGLRAATSDVVLFLNNDIRQSFDRKWGEDLLDKVAEGILVGAHYRNSAHTAVDGIPNPYLDGWCIGGMKQDLLDLGGWDESYAEPSYYGDNDLCLRATVKGFLLMPIDVPIYHTGNTTSKIFDLSKVTPANYAKFAERVREYRRAK